MLSLSLALLLTGPSAWGQEELEEAPALEPPPLSACQQVTASDGPLACIEILPPGASAWVTLDGVALGLSPLGIPELAPGPHALRLDRLGEQPWVETFTLQPGEIRRFEPSLAALPTRVPPPGPEAPYPLAVMVENHPDARPHVGLDRADVVYDALAEGGISRFLALFMTRSADAIGPVRSTRHYFVYTAAEFNATLVHIGASPIGYAALGATGIRNVNESWGDAGIWRSVRRDAPHDAFTSTEDARTAADAKGPGGPGSWGPLIFKDPADRAVGPPATSLRIDYPPGGWYQVEYAYDPTTNGYLRAMDGYRHRDGASGEQLNAANVIVQVVPDEVIDREGRLDLLQTGEGKAYYFVDGTVQEGTWTKSDFGSRTIYWDSAGNEVRVNRGGTTWIQLIPTTAELTFS